jgi:hypothetical protein
MIVSESETLTFIGIDPGLTGGISIFDLELSHGRLKAMALIDSLKMPVCPSARYKTKKGNRINVGELSSILSSYQPAMGCIELVSAMPAQNKSGKTVQGISSTFSFGYGTGMTEAVLLLHEVELEWVMPTVWKRHFNLLKTSKLDAVNLANEYWPNFEFTKLAHSGRADAALIGCYGIHSRFNK